MNVLYVNARFLTQPMTGVQRFSIEISKCLKKRMGDKVFFVCPNKIVNQQMAEELEAITIGCHQGHLWEQLDLPLYLKRKGNPLLLNLANTAPVIYKNKISTVHDLAIESYPQTFSKKFLYTYKLMLPQVVKCSLHVITVSEFSKLEINKFYKIPLDKISVVYNAVSVDFRHSDIENDKKNIYLLAVSSFNYRKNFIAVLKAYLIFSVKHPDVDLFIIGDVKSSIFKGIDISEFMNNPKIKFIGRVSDEELINYYSNAAGFVYPSIYEGFGIPPLEAQNCNCPVLCSFIPPLREVFRDSVLYCNPHNFTDIAHKMTDLIELSDFLRLKGQENIKRFSWIKSAEEIIEIINRFNLVNKNDN